MKKKGQLEIVGQFVDGMEAMRSGVWRGACSCLSLT